MCLIQERSIHGSDDNDGVRQWPSSVKRLGRTRCGLWPRREQLVELDSDAGHGSDGLLGRPLGSPDRPFSRQTADVLKVVKRPSDTTSLRLGDLESGLRRDRFLARDCPGVDGHRTFSSGSPRDG
jgi:hypothetical protein